MTAPAAPLARRGTEIRVDIQILRALAILFVLAHHARLPFVPAGFLGVDLFFVISGYLMAGLIDAGLAEKRFRFADFYARRVRRLLPAAYATLVATAIAAPLLLDSLQYRDFLAQLGGSFLFVANMVLWKQSEYFGGEAALKPLLHMWSLAVEEQFYLLLPLAMALLPGRARLPLALLATVASALLCWWLRDRAPSAAFYFLPTRACELGIGVVTALAVRRGLVVPRPMAVMRTAAWMLLACLPLFASEAGHPGLAAGLVCLATALLLVPGAPALAREGIARPLAAIGDRSYSLYLVHWPVFALVANVWLVPVPFWLNLVLLALCLLLAEIQYRLVERPLRRLRLTRFRLVVLLLIPALTLGLSYARVRQVAPPQVVAARAANVGLSPACEYSHGFTAAPVCETGARTKTLVWGDSIAIALVPGFAATTPGMVQATRTVCGPFLGLAPMNGGQYPRGWAESCIAYNDAVLAYLAQHPEIGTVVLSGALAALVPGAEDRGWHVLARSPKGLGEASQSLTLLTESLTRTVEAIHGLGRRVVLFAPPPSTELDPARCLDRQRLKLPSIGAPEDCSFDAAAYAALRKPVLDWLESVRAAHIVPVLTLDAMLCEGGRCRTEIDGVPLYRDHLHLSTPGAALLGRRMQWGALADRTAL